MVTWTVLVLLSACEPGTVIEGGKGHDSRDSGIGDDTDTAVDTDTAPPSPSDADDDGHDAIAAGGDDCDDTLANVHPGATEACDGLDQDCDGEDIPDGSCGQDAAIGTSTSATLEGAREAEGVYVRAPLGDADGDGIGDLSLKATYPAPGEEDATGGVAFVSGASVGVVGEVSSTKLPIWTGLYLQDLTDASAAAGDMNGDGLGDLWIIARSQDSYEGGAFLFLGREGGWEPGAVPARDAADGWWYQDDRSWGVREVVLSGADLDGDGHPDTVIGLGNSRADALRLAVLLGGTDISTERTPISDLPYTEIDYESLSMAGMVGLGADLDGDGGTEALVATSGTSSAEYLVAGPDTVRTDGSDFADRLVPISYDRGSGYDTPFVYPVEGRPPDIDGDGLQDWAAWDQEKDGDYQEQNCIMVFTGGFPTGNLAEVEHARICPPGDPPMADSRTLAYPQWTEDVDQDGVADLIAALFTPSHPDGAYCIFSTAPLVAGGVTDPDEMRGPCWAADGYDEFIATDITGDGRPELIFSDLRWDSPTAGTYAGRIRVIEGFDIPWDDPSKW